MTVAWEKRYRFLGGNPGLLYLLLCLLYSLKMDRRKNEGDDNLALDDVDAHYEPQSTIGLRSGERRTSSLGLRTGCSARPGKPPACPRLHGLLSHRV